MESIFMCLSQVCMRRYLREIWLLLQLTGECHFRECPNNTVLYTINIWNILYKISSSPISTVSCIFVYFVCVQLACQVWRGDAACSDDTTFTRLMEFCTSFPETAATCSLGTATTAPSRFWVSRTQMIHWRNIQIWILMVSDAHPVQFSVWRTVPGFGTHSDMCAKTVYLLVAIC